MYFDPISLLVDIGACIAITMATGLVLRDGGRRLATTTALAPPKHPLGITELQDAEDGREGVDQEVGGRAAGIVPVHPPLEEARDAEIDLGGVAQEAVPEQIRPRLRGGIGNRHPLAPVAATEETARDVDRACR